MGSSFVGSTFGDAGLLTTLKFSREHEEQSDETAMAALAKLNGHIAGVDTFFGILDKINKEGLQPPEFFSSHPHMESRVANISLMAERYHWQTNGPIIELPTQFGEWIKESE